MAITLTYSYARVRQALKVDPFNSGFSIDGTQICTSAVPHCGKKGEKSKRMKESSVIGSVSEMTEQVLLPITILLRQSEHYQIVTRMLGS